ncbi:hypothetical protein BP5796_07347 [Coleophoma crateriformis]|uniref:C2H2-type domain-containing protein n=1 Tax=Coleophoma crateriformis TaxID=565419 RepID=A0A3D8RIN6_9HELO|nr:hypothetical protein BP5796_07347 [Coleophoma crateriformis]
MLSNPNNNLQNRQRLHRRQNSTPNAFEAAKVNALPNLQRHGSHRRGISLDQRRRQTPPQDYTHILRETQQQRLVRPGQQYQHYDNDENYKSSPAVTPHRQSFDAACMGNFEAQRMNSPYPYSGPINTTMSVDPNSFPGANDFNLYTSDGNLTPSAFLDFSHIEGMSQSHSAPSSKRSSRRISGGILDRVAQFENMATMKTERPITPPNQNASGYFPLTPANTPFDRLSKHDQQTLLDSFETSMNGTVKPKSQNRRFHESYDTSMEETIKPRSNQRARGVFEDMRQAAEMNAIPSPPGSAQIPSTTSFDSAPMPSANFMNMSNLHIELVDYNGTQYSPTSNNFSPALSYRSASPEMAHMPLVGDPYSNKPDLRPSGMVYSSDGLSMNNSPVHSSHRRSESVNSINLEETITETGITIDDIASFIQGPDTNDGKWLCLFPDCNKRFGRKENIKSHVQTHLGDRQFQCPHCQKCFVRQHDLKRHAKIHTGIKPYPCQCGNSFARHDALTRHRQRGMCIGAFEGVVKKVVKRGRPKKHRPDNEERVKKSSRTRSKNKEKAQSYASSTSGASEASYATSPADEMDILDDKPFGFDDYSQPISEYHQYPEALSPKAAGCISPQDIHSVHSPSALSTHSHFSTQHESSHPASPAKSYHSPPGLCNSSSSPPASNQFYDADAVTAHGAEADMAALTNISEQDEDMFLEAFATGTGNMTQLERDPDLLMAKFDDSFGSAVGEDLFRNSDDVFFGSP